MKIGILAVQGGFHAHRRILEALEVDVVEVRLPRDLHHIQGLILPGGESTTMLKMLAAFDLMDPLKDFAKSERPVLGTCAGAILMSNKVNFKNQASLGWLPVSIDRNVYGSQRDSFYDSVSIPSWQLSEIPAYFIRAPRFVDLGEGVAVLSQWHGDVTGVCYRHFTAVTYHPELADDTRFHQAWLDHAVRSRSGAA